MKRLIVLFSLCPLMLLGQTAPEKYWVQFTDKSNTPYSLSNPLEFLSQRALDRRSAQSIALDDSDLPVDPNYIQQVESAGAQFLTKSNWLNSVSVHVPDSAVLNAITALPFVVSTEAVGRLRGDREIEKFEQLKSFSGSSSSSPEDDYGLAYNQIDMLGGLSLHGAGYMGQGMVIAVLDAGFTNVDQLSVFDSLNQSGRLLSTWDFVSQHDSVYNDHTHGMAVLSTMAAYEPGTMIGTAPLASYILLRTEDGGSEFPIEEDYWVAGAEYADSAGADVINSSLGYTTFDNSIYDHTYEDMDGNTTRCAIGADIAASKGILVISSAGNQGNSPWQYIGSPADGDSVLAIGAVNSEGVRASFSSIGPSSDGDIKPNVCAQGEQSAIVHSNGTIITGNGTSFAGPILAGMAACLWQAYPTLTNMEIFEAIEVSAHLHSNPDFLMGHGIPNFAMANLVLSGFTPSNLEEDELFTVYPNPFTNSVEGVFYSSGKQDLLIRLVDGLGQEIDRFEGGVGETCAVPFSFSKLNHLASGIYYLQVMADSGNYEQKLLKLKP